MPRLPGVEAHQQSRPVIENGDAVSANWFFGFHPVREALRQHPERVLRVRIDERKDDHRRNEIERACEEAGIQAEAASASWFNDNSSVVHNGFAAELAESEKVAAERDSGLVVLAEDIQDPRNLGALVRVCEGAGVDQLLVRDRGSTQAMEVVEKTSAGALSHLPIERITNSAREIERLQEDGFWVYGADGAGAAPWDLDLSGKLALIVGGEQKGLRRLTKERCDGLVGLPMLGQVGSLNLATAASAILYDAVRQRTGAS